MLFHYKIENITIYPFGGITKINKDLNAPIYKELLIASGGVIFQLLLFLIINYLPLSVYVKSNFIKYNFSILFFNLLPIIPLDGSVILNSFLNMIFSYKKSYYLYFIISIIGIFIYLIANIWFSLNNYLIISLFVIKTIYAWKNYKFLLNRFLLERYINKYEYKYINTKEGNLDILKINTYQYFKENGKIVSEMTKLKERFDKQY